MARAAEKAPHHAGNESTLAPPGAIHPCRASSLVCAFDCGSHAVPIPRIRLRMGVGTFGGYLGRCTGSSFAARTRYSITHGARRLVTHVRLRICAPSIHSQPLRGPRTRFIAAET